MLVDELRRELADMASATPADVGDVRRAVVRGRRRVAVRRAGIGITAVAVIAGAALVLVSRDDAPRGVKVVHPSPTPTTDLYRPSTPGPARSDVVFTAPDEGWICARPLLHTANGGATWQSIRLEGLAAGSPVCGFASSGAAWVASSAVDAATLALVQGGSDSGVSVDLPLGPGESIRQIEFVDRDHGWVLADSKNGTSLYRTVQGGLRATQIARNLPLTKVAFETADVGWGFVDGVLLRTTDGGATWAVVDDLPVPGGVAGEAPVTITDVDAQESAIVVAGRVLTNGRSAETFFVTSDDGARTWTMRLAPFDVAPTTPGVLSAVNVTNIRYAVEDEVWATDDGGETWEVRGRPGAVRSMSFPTAQEGWVVVDGSTQTTSDGGRTWRRVDTTPQPAWRTGLAPVPDGCPSQPVDSNRTSDIDGAVDAAKEFLERTRGWNNVDPEAWYEVVGSESFGDPVFRDVFTSNVPKYCGAAVAEGSVGVEFNNPGITQTSSRSTPLVVGHFADGWQVWGYYR